MAEKIDLGNGKWTDGEFTWEYEKDGATLKNVVYLGKFPKISHYWSHNKGSFWEIIFPGTFRLMIPKIHVHLREFRSTVFYATKAFRSVKSGFVELQQKFNFGDVDEWETATDGDPFYVCAVFENRKHVPLPIIQRWADRDFERISGGFIQQLAILVAGALNPESLLKTIQACDAYMAKFELNLDFGRNELLSEEELKEIL